MIVTVLYVAFRSKPPVVEAISSVGHLNEFPNLVFPIITLLGGSCAVTSHSPVHIVFWMQVSPEPRIFPHVRPLRS